MSVPRRDGRGRNGSSLIRGSALGQWATLGRVNTERQSVQSGCPLSDSTNPRLTPSPLLHRGISALASMGEIFAEQLDRHRRASARFVCRDDIRKRVSGVVAVRLLSAGRDDRRAADCHPPAVVAAPVTIDCIRVPGRNKSKKRRTCSSSWKKHPLSHVPVTFVVRYSDS